MAPQPIRLNDDLQLGDGRLRIIVPLTGSTSSAVLDQARRAVDAGADLIEWRIDLLQAHTDLETVLDCLRQLGEAIAPVVLLATVRTGPQGGKADLGDADYLSMIEAIAESGVARLIDVEHLHPLAQRAIDAVHRAGALVVGSHHDFDTPSAEVMEGWLAEQEQMSCDVCKVAVEPHSQADLATLLYATARRFDVSSKPLLTMAMARYGVSSRLIGAEVGSCATFASVGAGSAPGQLPIAQVRAVLDVLEGAPK